MKDAGGTIAAIATAQAPAGIGIIRISGPRAHAVGDALFRDLRGERALTGLSAGVLRHGVIVDAAEERIDEIMAVLFRAPRSYTGEDMVELQCHGGLLVLRRALEAALVAGARLAEPGEFTKRAFLNGRIDLTQAEAVMDVIAAENDFALRNAEREMAGALFLRIRGLREELLRESAFIEAALDDPESFSGELEGYGARLSAVIASAASRIDKLLQHADDGILLREGVRCAIIGKPNAGKSSLLNLLAGRERSIVTEIPGTTRDTVEERVRIGGITLRLIDTAGIVEEERAVRTCEDGYAGRNTTAPAMPCGDVLSSGGEAGALREQREADNFCRGRRALDAVERIGIERARQALAEAEAVLFVLDVSEPVSEEVRRLFAETEGKRRILICNKIDLIAGNGADAAASFLSDDTPTVFLSAKTGEGADELRKALTALLLRDDGWRGGDVVIANARHKRLLEEARASLDALRRTIGEGMTEDFYTVDLMDAYRALGEIIGEEIGEDLVNEIFSRFCMGK